MSGSFPTAGSAFARSATARLPFLLIHCEGVSARGLQDA